MQLKSPSASGSMITTAGRVPIAAAKAEIQRPVRRRLTCSATGLSATSVSPGQVVCDQHRQLVRVVGGPDEAADLRPIVVPAGGFPNHLAIGFAAMLVLIEAARESLP